MFRCEMQREGDVGQQEQQHRDGRPPPAQRERADDREQRQQEDLAVDGVEVGAHELLGLPQDRAVAEEPGDVRAGCQPFGIEQAGHQRQAERRSVVARPGEPSARGLPAASHPRASSPAA